MRIKVGDGLWSHSQKIGPEATLDKTVTHYHYQFANDLSNMPQEGWSDTISMPLNNHTWFRRRL